MTSGAGAALKRDDPCRPPGSTRPKGSWLHLGDYPVDRILCSPTVSRQKTVQPLARDRLLEIEPAAALGVDADSTETLEPFWDRRLANAVLCTHGETIGQLFAQLAGQGLVAPEPPALAEGFDLAAAPHRLAAGSYPLPVPAGTGPPTAHRLTGDERRLARSRHRGRNPSDPARSLTRPGQELE